MAYVVWAKNLSMHDREVNFNKDILTGYTPDYVSTYATSQVHHHFKNGLHKLPFKSFPLTSSADDVISGSEENGAVSSLLRPMPTSICM